MRQYEAKIYIPSNKGSVEDQRVRLEEWLNDNIQPYQRIALGVPGDAGSIFILEARD